MIHVYNSYVAIYKLFEFNKANVNFFFFSMLCHLQEVNTLRKQLFVRQQGYKFVIIEEGKQAILHRQILVYDENDPVSPSAWYAGHFNSHTHWTPTWPQTCNRKQGTTVFQNCSSHYLLHDKLVIANNTRSNNS